MAKARMYGMKSSFVPNNQADLRFRCKQHLRSKEIIESEKRLLDKGYRSVRRYKEAQDG